MPALTLDIKTPNTLEKMALKTAKALDQVAAREAKINALMAKGFKTGKVSAELQKKTSTALMRMRKNIIDTAAREIAQGSKRDADQKKQLSFTDKLSKHYLMVRDAVMVAWRAGKAMTIDMMEKGNELEKTTAAMKFEVDMFSSGTDAGAQFKEIQKFAGKSVKLQKEMTDQWIKFRNAGNEVNVVTNEQAAGMLRVWADIRAISQSSEEASKVTDEWISKFKESPYAAARFLTQVKATHKEFSKIGSGDPFKHMKGPLALEDKMEAANNKMVAALAPLTKLMNDLKSSFADFMSKLAGNKTFRNFVKEIADDIRWLISDKGLPAMGRAIADFFTKFGQETDKFIGSTGSALDKIGDFFKDAFKYINPVDIIKTMQQGPNGGPPPPLRAPAPAEPKKTGMLAPKVEKQLAGITIQNLNVTGAGDDTEQIARSVRQELQLLLQAGALSKGYA